MKKLLLVIPICLLLIGCTNKVEDEKLAYIEYKNNLEKQEEFTNIDNLDFNIFFDITREKDMVNYSLVINNPTKDMKEVKALLIHDYVNIDVFPSIGIFDDTKTLSKGTSDSIILKGSINSADDLSNVKFKLYIEYLNENNEKEEIYYEVQRG